MPASSVIKTSNDGKIEIIGGGGTIYVSPFSVGDISISGLRAHLQELQIFQARGVVTGRRYGPRTFPTLQFSEQFANFTGNSGTSTTGSLLDVVMMHGSVWGSEASTLSTAAGVPKLVDVRVTVEGSDLGDTGDHTVTLHDVDLTADWSEGEPNTVSVSGQVTGEVTGDVDSVFPS